MLRTHCSDRVSVAKYVKKSTQPPTSQTDKFWSCLQNNNNNAYYVELAGGSINNNNKYNQYVVRACHENSVSHRELMETFIEAYYDCRKNKRMKNECIRFSHNWETKLCELVDNIYNRTYTPSPSNAFIVNYPTYREIFAAQFIDRIVHHWIALRLEPLMEEKFIDTTYNCRKGRGNTYGIEKTCKAIEKITEGYKKRAYVMKWDFSGYFMSIKKDVLWEMILELINSDYHENDKDILIYLTRKVLYNEPNINCNYTSPLWMWDKYIPDNKTLRKSPKNIGIPIGNLTSQLFANFYLWMIDRIAVTLFKHYSRYVDDGWAIDTDKRRMLNNFKEFKKILTPYGIKPHLKKFYFQEINKGIKIIGVVIKPYRVYISNRTVGKATQRIWYYNNITPNKDNIKKFQASLNSYLGLMKQYCTFKIRNKLLSQIDRKWFKFVFINKNKTKIIIKKKYRVKHEFYKFRNR